MKDDHWSESLSSGTEMHLPIVLDERTLAGNAQLLLGFGSCNSNKWMWENDLLQDTKFVAKVNAWRALSPAAKEGITLQYTREFHESAEKDACGQEIDSRAMVSSVRSCIPGELTKHAVSEGTKAVRNLTRIRDARPGCPISEASGLRIPVELVGSISALLAGCPGSRELLRRGLGVYRGRNPRAFGQRRPR